MNNKKVMPTTEIVGSILQTRVGEADLANFKSSPQAFLQDQGIDFADVDIAVIENESSMVHLCLPYYDSLADISSEALADSDLTDASGGEIIIFSAAMSALILGGGTASITGAVVGGVIGGVAGAALLAGFVVAGKAHINAAEDKYLDGSPK